VLRKLVVATTIALTLASCRQGNPFSQAESPSPTFPPASPSPTASPTEGLNQCQQLDTTIKTIRQGLGFPETVLTLEIKPDDRVVAVMAKVTTKAEQARTYPSKFQGAIAKLEAIQLSDPELRTFRDEYLNQIRALQQSVAQGSEEMIRLQNAFERFQKLQNQQADPEYQAITQFLADATGKTHPSNHAELKAQQDKLSDIRLQLIQICAGQL